jgi:hypothetical protein
LYKTPLLLLIFNRPDLTETVFSVIKQIKPSFLFIAADGPRRTIHSDIDNCEKARKITEQIDWECKVERLYHNYNLGSSLAPRTAYRWFFSNVQEGIILEDDCVPHLDFFHFASLMLDRYRNDTKIFSINGSNFGYNLESGDSYTFTRYMNMWGWATWSNRINNVDYSLSQWEKIEHPILFLYQKLRNNIFDFDIAWYLYWKDKFDKSLNNTTVTWWDWQCIFYQILSNQYSIVPSVNLVTNIGFSSSATHTTDSSNPASNIKTESIAFPIVHPKALKVDFKYEEKCVKWIWCYHTRISILSYFKTTILKYLLIK